MIYPYLYEDDGPILKGPKAFERIGEDSSQSQAAVLLQIGRQLRDDDAEAAALPPAVRRRAAERAEEDDAEFPVPKVGAAPGRLLVSETAAEVERKYSFKLARRAKETRWSEAYAGAASDLYHRPTAEGVAELLVLALNHPMELPAVAAAAAAIGVATSAEECLKILRKGVRSDEDIVREVAATALARFAPEDPALRRLVKERRPRGGGGAAHTALIVHGTWAASESWWRRGGGFFGYVEGFRPDLYGAPDAYRWSGGYSAAARELAANQLTAWVGAHAAQGLDLLAHSHGGSVAMRASHLAMSAGKLVLLSCPVHAVYTPDFANVREVHSVRVKWDLVILADRGGQRFSDPRIQEHVLPIWFKHAATHDQQVWMRCGVRAMIGM